MTRLKSSPYANTISTEIHRWVAISGRGEGSTDDVAEGKRMAHLQVFLVGHGQLGPGSQAVLHAGDGAVMAPQQEGAIAGPDAVLDAAARLSCDCRPAHLHPHSALPSRRPDNS